MGGLYLRAGLENKFIQFNDDNDDSVRIAFYPLFSETFFDNLLTARDDTPPLGDGQNVETSGLSLISSVDSDLLSPCSSLKLKIHILIFSLIMTHLETS